MSSGDLDEAGHDGTSTYRPYPLIGTASSTVRPDLNSSAEFQTLDVGVTSQGDAAGAGDGGDGNSEGGSHGSDTHEEDHDNDGGGDALLNSGANPRDDVEGGGGNAEDDDVEEYGHIDEKEHLSWFSTLCPASRWIRTYSVAPDFCSDTIAGLTVGIIAVPIGMSDAALAGLPVQYGLYSSFIPMYIYALFGSSREMTIGPAALLSLVLHSGLYDIVYPNGYTNDAALSEMYSTLAIQICFLSGLAYIGMGLLRLGFIMDLLRDCVVSGFTTGAAILIMISQLSPIVGYSLGHENTLPDVLNHLFSGLSDFNIRTFLVGISCMIVLVNIKRVGTDMSPSFWWLKNTGPLIVSTLSIAVSYFSDSESRGIPVVGYVPRGLPDFTVALWTPVQGGGRTAATVLAVIAMGFMKHLTVARQLASKGNYNVNPSHELVGLGLTNLCGAAFQGTPVMGSLSRSAVNIESGAKSQMSGVICATFVMLSLLCLAPVFQPLPTSVLSSIVIVGVSGLVDVKGASFYWKADKVDFLLWCLSCFCTMFLGVDIGMAISIGSSALLIIAEFTGCRKPYADRKENEAEKSTGFGRERTRSLDDFPTLSTLID